LAVVPALRLRYELLVAAKAAEHQPLPALPRLVGGIQRIY
jgi:hypothetical protein